MRIMLKLAVSFVLAMSVQTSASAIWLSGHEDGNHPFVFWDEIEGKKVLCAGDFEGRFSCLEVDEITEIPELDVLKRHNPAPDDSI